MRDYVESSGVDVGGGRPIVEACRLGSFAPCGTGSGEFALLHEWVSQSVEDLCAVLVGPGARVLR
jgi:hypothetical protein